MPKTNRSVFTNKIQDLVDENFNDADDFFNTVASSEAFADPYPIGPQEGAANTEAQSASSPSQIDLRDEEHWLQHDNESYEGQLAMDVYQDKKNIYIKAAIAGIRPEDIDIQLNNDMITIRGKRQLYHENVDDEDYYIKECYWGGFSRSIILPVDIKTDQVQATIEDGLLTITLPKSKRPRHTKIKVKQVKQ